jgi:hypothetical protein
MKDGKWEMENEVRDSSSINSINKKNYLLSKI